MLITHSTQCTALPSTQDQQFCRNREQCRLQAASIQKRMHEVRSVVFADYEQLLEDHMFCVSEHAERRMTERNISLRAVYEVLECYQPIEWFYTKPCGDKRDILSERLFGKRPYRVLVAGESEIACRTLHVVCSYGERVRADQEWSLKILTVYDPSEEAHKWSEGFTKRICFCEEEQATRKTYVQEQIERYYANLNGASTVVFTCG